MVRRIFCLMSLVLVMAAAGNVAYAQLGEYYVIEDFESYSTFLNLYNKWDGTGDTLGFYNLNFEYPHGGTRCLSINYWTFGPQYYNGVARTETPWVPEDWTFDGEAKILSLWFRGNPNLASGNIDELYVRLKDNLNREATVQYTDNWPVSNFYIDGYQEWNISLSEFTDDNPAIDLTHVKMLEMGVLDGLGNPPAQGGEDYIYFDDIRLVRRLAATAPSPADGVQKVSPRAILGWQADPRTFSHDVYFGTSLVDVTNANNTWPVGTSVYKGNQPIDANTYDPVGGLESEQTYYWRIDEADTYGIYTGDIWSFTVKRYIASDFTGDYLVDINDVKLMALQWLDSGQGLEADGNFDGQVNFKDHCVLANDWLLAIQPPADECDDWQILHPE